MSKIFWVLPKIGESGSKWLVLSAMRYIHKSGRPSKSNSHQAWISRKGLPPEKLWKQGVGRPAKVDRGKAQRSSFKGGLRTTGVTMAQPRSTWDFLVELGQHFKLAFWGFLGSFKVWEPLAQDVCIFRKEGEDTTETWEILASLRV